MDILAVLVVLLVLLLASTWSSAKSYFARGRLAGMEEATLEIIRGVCSHYEAAGQAAPDYVAKAVEAVKTFARGATYEKSIYRYQARLWIFGDAIGAACITVTATRTGTIQRPSRVREVTTMPTRLGAAPYSESTFSTRVREREPTRVCWVHRMGIRSR